MSTPTPREWELEHAPISRMYPTERARGTVPLRDVDPDAQIVAAVGPATPLEDAAAQRAAARRNESRVALTTGDLGSYAPDALMAPPGTGPVQPFIAQPDDDGE